MEAMRKVFGQNVEIFMTQIPTGMVRCCHLGFPTPQIAQKMVETLQGQSVRWQHPSFPQFQSEPLFLDYVTINQKSKDKQQARESGSVVEKFESSRAECTSSTDHVRVPGLVVVEEYLSEGQEEALMAVLQNNVTRVKQELSSEKFYITDMSLIIKPPMSYEIEATRRLSKRTIVPIVHPFLL